jgi:hypothetical protein
MRASLITTCFVSALAIGTAQGGQPLDLHDHEARLAAYSDAVAACLTKHNKSITRVDNPTIHRDPTILLDQATRLAPQYTQSEIHPDSPRPKYPDYFGPVECRPLINALHAEQSR